MIRAERTVAVRLPPGQRRRSIVLAYANGGLWGLGNGLAGSTLLFYLAHSFNATGLQLSWLLAAPSLVGVLRLLTPLWMDRVGDRQRFCVRMFLASAAVLLAVPIVSAPNVLPEAARSVTALIVGWAGYHLLEYFAVVALWSWLGDLVPRRIRGRFVGRRAAWMNAGKVAGAVLAVVGTLWWRHRCEIGNQPDQLWMAYAMIAGLGSLLMIAAVGPLIRMNDPPSPSGIGHRGKKLRMRELVRPFADPRFRRLLIYGWWFSFANGITDTAVRIYLIAELKLEFAEKRVLDSSSRGIQSLVMPWAGVQADRHGNVVVLIVSQGLVAAALLFLLIASPAAKWWVIGAYVMWIAYAGTNVAMPNAMLRLSRAECSAAYTAAWFASTQFAYAISALAGGALYDLVKAKWTPRAWQGYEVDHFALFFLVGWLLRSLGMAWAARIRE